MRHLIVLILAALVEFSAGNSKRTWESGVRCPPLGLPNGRVRTQSRGKFARFTCSGDYTLVGNKYSVCIRGRWDTPTPVCVNSQCPVPPPPDHALVATKYDGAIAMYFCEPGYILVGDTEIYCNGRKWNATVPYCRDSTAAAPTSCDFEKSDLCWWEQDPTHDFDWQRHNHDTPSSRIGTGPSHDHTFGPGYDGYYLYIEASGRLVNDTARIVSPLYNASLTDSGCFSFWYHMYGATIGALKVYFKPERDSSQLMFEKHGNQGNQWLRGNFSLPTSNTSFQIIIEGVRGASYVSDMAVDDLAILQGDECSALRETSSVIDSVSELIPTNYDQIEYVNAVQSCRGRCENNLGLESPVTILPPGSPDACRCDLDCAQTSMCCPDFGEYCILGVPDWTTKSLVVSSTQISTTKPFSPLPWIPAKKPISISPKDDIDPLARNTEISPTTLSTTTTTTTTTKIIPTTTRIPKKKIKIETTSRKPVTTKSTTLTHAETPFVSTTTKSWQESARVTARTEAHVRAKQATIQQLGTSMSLGVSGIATIVIVITSAIILTAIVSYVMVRKRKSYKRGAGGSGSALSEDSDVRFLTSDEILDFNVARPSEYDEL